MTHTERETWVCDGGCGFTTDDPNSSEAEAHYRAQLDLPDDKVRCWGLYPVGSETERAYLEDGIHPMVEFTRQVALVALDHAEMFQGRVFND